MTIKNGQTEPGPPPKPDGISPLSTTDNRTVQSQSNKSTVNRKNEWSPERSRISGWHFPVGRELGTLELDSSCSIFHQVIFYFLCDKVKLRMSVKLSVGLVRPPLHRVPGLQAPDHKSSYLWGGLGQWKCDLRHLSDEEDHRNRVPTGLWQGDLPPPPHLLLYAGHRSHKPIFRWKYSSTENISA